MQGDNPLAVHLVLGSKKGKTTVVCGSKNFLLATKLQAHVTCDDCLAHLS